MDRSAVISGSAYEGVTERMERPTVDSSGLTGRLETYMDDSLVWTSYFIGADHAEAEFVDTVDMMTGEMFT